MAQGPRVSKLANKVEAAWASMACLWKSYGVLPVTLNWSKQS